MSKVLDFFKKIPDAYYNWKRRNERLNEFLEGCKDTKDRLEHIDQAVTGMQREITNIKCQIDQVNGRLEHIGAGTKMELFDTLHRLRVDLVMEKKWASPAEKHEVEEIYKIYRELKGNGQGERYYNEIMALPESQEEYNKRREGIL